jgi:uroporphyrinogen-III synthase
MRILVTRPEPDAAELRVALEARGHEVSLEPLLTVEALPIDPSDLEGAGAVIATSRNGLRALDGQALARATKLPLFCVGPATAELATKLGFRHIIEGPGAASDLIPLIIESKLRETGKFVHLSGEEVAFDLSTALAERGVAVRRLIVYRAKAATALKPQMMRAVTEGSLDAVILMSPRTAAIFAELVDKAGLREAARKLAYVCLSANVADALKGLDPARVNIAVRPNSSGILHAVEQVATHSSGV